MKMKSAKLEPSSFQTPLGNVGGWGGGGGGAVDAGSERKRMTKAENVCVCVCVSYMVYCVDKNKVTKIYSL